MLRDVSRLNQSASTCFPYLLRFRVVLLTVLLLGIVIPVRMAFGGGGPENVFLVVNSRSWASRTIANHYVQFRGVPASNVLHLDWPHSVYAVSFEGFRDTILAPTFAAIDQRKLSEQIDYIVYSSDLPYAVDFTPQATQGDKFPVASLTGMTYLSALSPDNKRDFRALDANWYSPIGRDGRLVRPARGFRSQYGWNQNSEPTGTGGQNYVLSIMLGFNSGRGNSVPEIVNGLRQASLADGTRPSGTIYYADSGDRFRSGTRQPGVAAAIRELNRLNIQGEVIATATPTAKQDILGAMLGVATFQWDSQNSRLLPGAIVENLTSYGGVLRPDSSQTPISEMIRAGAAGTSGTVVEPYAVAQKFPDPLLHAFYGAGCSLGEAFYQAVRAPYQLLILGDPLCQPWAIAPRITVDGITPGQTVSGTIELTPRCESCVTGAPAIGHYRLYLDGRLFAKSSPDAGFRLASEKLPDGYHELRIVGFEQTPIETQGRVIIPFTVNNVGRMPTAKLLDLPEARVPLGKVIRIELDAPTAERIILFDNRQPIAQWQGEHGIVDIATDHFGLGPIELNAVALYKKETDDSNAGPSHASSAPLTLEILPPPMIAGKANTLPNLKEGLQIIHNGEPAHQVVSTANGNWLSTVGGKVGKAFRLNGRYECKHAGVHQLQIEFRGTISITINDQLFYENSTTSLEREFIPLHLGEGWHVLEIAGKLDDVDNFLIDFGETGTRPLDSILFRH